MSCWKTTGFGEFEKLSVYQTVKILSLLSHLLFLRVLPFILARTCEVFYDESYKNLKKKRIRELNNSFWSSNKLSQLCELQSASRK